MAAEDVNLLNPQKFVALEQDPSEFEKSELLEGTGKKRKGKGKKPHDLVKDLRKRMSKK
jgi:hypothetical protein